MKSDMHDIDVIYQTETDRAVCVREDEDDDSPDIWIPLSQCEVDGDMRRGGVVTLTAPDWLLADKGLV